MPLTLTEYRSQVRRRANDKAGIVWKGTEDIDAEIQNALSLAWPEFYLRIEDSTSFSGANALDQNTTSIDVPAAFLTPPGGKIYFIEARMSDGTDTETTMPWFLLTKGLRIEPFTVTAPRIIFRDTISRPCELRIVGGVPITAPSADGETIPPTPPTGVLTMDTVPGFTEWLIAQTAALLHGGKARNNSLDRDAHFMQAQIQQQRADTLKMQYKMKREQYQLYNRF